MRSVLCVALCVVGCSAGTGGPADFVSGSGGTGGAAPGAGGGAATGAGGLIDVGDASASRSLSAHIERDRLEIEFVTLACAGECADVVAVARGGFAPHAYAWEDGSTNPARRVCPNATTSYLVTVTDSGNDSPEFHRPPQTARASLTANVLQCPNPDAGPPSQSNTVYWAAWSVVTAGTPGSAAGTLSPPGGDVPISYAGELRAESQPQTGTTNNFMPVTTYTSATVQNPPPDPGILTLSGSSGSTYVITFSAPVRDPVIAVWSIGFGSLGIPSTWAFDAQPVVLKYGPNAGWPASTLTASGNSITGNEGNGLLQFTGTFTSITFTVPTPEPFPGYGGFTVGIRGRG
jgi:hypothetical protein